MLRALLDHTPPESAVRACIDVYGDASWYRQNHRARPPSSAAAAVVATLRIHGTTDELSGRYSTH